MTSHPVRVITPDTFASQESPFPADFFERGLLAQGDSWFSIGAIPPTLTTNLLDELVLARAAYVVNCAAPGRELRLMADTTTSLPFLRLLRGNMAQKWDAILLSGGGNDLIAWALGTRPSRSDRLFLLPSERPPGLLEPAQYLSDDGWSHFEFALIDVFAAFIDAREAGINQGVPVILHTYDLPAPRPAPAGPGFGPCLSKAMGGFGVPQQDWNGVASLLFHRLETLLEDIAAHFPAATLVKTLGTLQPAQNADTGMTAGWCNEIHPTRAGYAKLAALWDPVIDAALN